MKDKIRVYVIAFFAAFAVSCSGLNSISGIAGVEESNCSTQTDYNYTENDLPGPIHELEIDSLVSAHFSFRSLNVAHAIGILNTLTDYLSLKNKYIADSTTDKRIRLLEIRQTINQKINLASLEVSSVASELDCEEERADQIANFLQSKKDNRERNLVIGSLIIGAAGTITSELLANQSSAGNASTVVAIGASLIEATLGVLILVNKKSVSFHHKRNTPGEIWREEKTSRTLPPSIWYYLNYKGEENDFKSLRDVIVENWVDFGQVSKRKKRERGVEPQLFFGRGGKYTADDLKARADMYDQIESYITLMKQDLKMLAIEFDKVSSESK